MLKLYLWMRNWLADEKGQTMAEYALILVLVSIVAIVALTTMGTQINTIFETIRLRLGGAAPAA